VALNQIATLLTNRLVRRNGGADGDHTVAREQIADEADAANVDIAILFTKAQPLAKIGANDVAIQNFNSIATLFELGFQQIRECALAGTGKTGEPQCKTLMHLCPH